MSMQVKVLRTIRLKPVIPAIIGLSLGFALSMIFIPVVEQQCLVDLEESHILKPLDSEAKPEPTVAPVDSSQSTAIPKTVAPKVTHWDTGFRPYYIASELGFKERLLVGVLLSEDELETFGMAINNTWAADVPKVIFFTPTMKEADSYERFHKVLGFPVVQLSDVEEDETWSRTMLSFRMLKYMYNHYANNYDWFMRADAGTYLKGDKLLDFVSHVNASSDFYIGQPRQFVVQSASTKGRDIYASKYYCQGSSGVLFTSSVLRKVAPFLDSCLEEAVMSEDAEIGNCILKNVGVSCTCSHEMSDLFFSIPSNSAASIESLLREKKTSKALTISPIKDNKILYRIHYHYNELELNKTFIETRGLQTSLKDLLPYLPDGVPEKTLTWPIGFAPPYKPKNRFEVISWSYFTNTHIYGFSSSEPAIPLEGDFKRDINEVYTTSVKMLMREYNSDKLEARLVNGYRQFDPQRGTEYILDIAVKESEVDTETLRRTHLLRPLLHVESVPMPTVTEQRGVHLVLPVTSEDTYRLEEFLQMYQQVCLQSGENVVLLTVFINVRSTGEKSEKLDSFGQAKALIARYKKKFTWAQLPWIQIGVKHNSLSLLMDIVTMKLPSSALIFLTSLGVDFTTKFLNRCRVNAMTGTQVFFPIPYVEYNPDIIYRDQPVPPEIPISKDTGRWDDSTFDLACFANKDYKDLRMNDENFLKEQEPDSRGIMKIFEQSNLLVFRAVDTDLKRQYQITVCDPRMEQHSYHSCLVKKSENLAARWQLAALKFAKEEEQKKESIQAPTTKPAPPRPPVRNSSAPLKEDLPPPIPSTGVNPTLPTVESD